MNRLLRVIILCGFAWVGYAQNLESDPAPMCPDPLMQPIVDALVKDRYRFTPAVRQAYLDYGEALCQKTLGKRINKKTWEWFKKTAPDVLSGAFSAVYPIDPNILIAFQRLALPLGATKARQWQQLILAYAIRYRKENFPIDRLDEEWDPERLMRMVAEQGDFAFQDDSKLPKLTDEEQQMLDWLQSPQYFTREDLRYTIPKLLDLPVHEINLVTRGKLKLTKFPNWENIALAGKFFPLPVDGTPSPQRSLAIKIWRWQKHPGNPMFAMDKADWPMLMYLTDLDQIDETQFLWNYFMQHKVQAPLGLGEDMSIGRPIEPKDPEFKFRKSKWHYSKFLRIYNGKKKDQGGKGWAFGLRATCVPASSVGAPPGGKFYYLGERGFYRNFYTAAVETDVSGVENYMGPFATVDPERPASGVKATTMIGLGITLSQGRTEYEDTRMALSLLKMLPSLTVAQRRALLESRFVRNPLDGDLMYALGDVYYQQMDYDATIRMMVGARRYFNVVLGKQVTPSLRTQAQKQAQTVFKNNPFVNASEAPAIPLSVLKGLYCDDLGWFHQVCYEIVYRNFKRAEVLGDLKNASASKEQLIRSREAVKAELDYQLKCCGEGGKASPIERRTKNMKELVTFFDKAIK